ncbi:MAG: hypothetical protein QGG09_16850, partial [Pirellulaceae bacterium]|nr:hypothetical protein [Pirellulaceae bacterium]
DDGLSWRNLRTVATEYNPGGEMGSLTALGDGSVLLQFLYTHISQMTLTTAYSELTISPMNTGAS